jgi:hypothetical protein
MLPLCQGWAGAECVDDGAGELAFEAADRFAAALALDLLALEVGVCSWVVAGLRACDLVEGGVELAVAARVEPVAFDAA